MPWYRTVIISALLFLFGTTHASAQYEVYIGYNFSGFVGPLHFGDQRSFKLGLSAGAGYDHQINDELIFHPELQFAIAGSQQTFKYWYPDFNDSFKMNLTRKSNISLYYLNMPLLFKYGIGSKFKFLLGPYFSFLSAVKINNEETAVITDGAGAVVSSNITEDEIITSSVFENFDTGISIGVHYDSNGKHFMGLRINRGFIDLTKEGNDYGRGEDNIINIQIMMGLHF